MQTAARFRLSGLLRAAAVLFVAFALIAFNGGIAIGVSNHVGLIPVVRRLMNPGYLPGDFNIELRIFHHRAFAYLLAFLTSVAGEDRAIIILHILSFVALAAALYFLSRSLSLPLHYYIFLGLLIATNVAWTGLGLEENNFAGNREVQPTTLAHAFVIAGTAALIRRRWKLAALFAGLATLLHLQIGLIFVIVISPLYAAELAGFRVREIMLIIASFLVPSFPAFLHLKKMFERGVGDSALMLSYLQWRMPHHFELISTAAAIWVIAHLIVLCLVFLWLRKSKNAAERGIGILLAISLTLSVLILIHFADYYVFHWSTTLKAQFPRLSPVITVFGTVAALVFLHEWKPQESHEKWRPVIVGVLAIAAIGDATRRLINGSLVFEPRITRYAEQRSDWVDVGIWIRANGPTDTTYLAPPGLYGFTYLTDRSSVVEFKINPDGGQFLKQWYERLKDLSGGQLPAERGLAARRPLDRAFAALDETQLLELAQKYHARAAVLPASSKASFPVLYQNKGFRVVELREQ
jgi:Domain of unknown function (DUF6798)